MTTSQALTQKAVIELTAYAMKAGDPHPMVQAVVIDTDPEPMPGNYIQVVMSYRALLPVETETQGAS